MTNKKRNKDFLYVKRTIQGCDNHFQLECAGRLVVIYFQKKSLETGRLKITKEMKEEDSALWKYFDEQEKKISKMPKVFGSDC